MLRIENLTKTYGEKRAVDNLSLHIAPGEIYGFIGHNGAGKTTTLKAVVGILQFDKGEVFIKMCLFYRHGKITIITFVSPELLHSLSFDLRHYVSHG